MDALQTNPLISWDATHDSLLAVCLKSTHAGSREGRMRWTGARAVFGPNAGPGWAAVGGLT